jgi:hypothetical protein
MPKGERLTLLKKEADSPFGKKLLSFIFDVCHDGRISLGEIESLHTFLLENPSDISAAVLLRAQTREMLSDNQIDPLDEYNLKTYFVRITPKVFRGIIETHLESIGLPVSAHGSLSWKNDRATARQIDYIIALGGKPSLDLTKGKASRLIDALLERRPPTPRQVMLLRFFNRLDLLDKNKDEVSEYIDGLFHFDTKYELAWARFKRETGQSRFNMDPSTVPIGACRQYMS